MAETHSQWYIGAPNGVVLCVDRADGGILSGRLYHSYDPEPEHFSDLVQATILMERLYDELRFPFAGTERRSFVPESAQGRGGQERKKLMSDASLLSRHGDIGTFIVRVQHRQNSSWQGRITWMEQDKTLAFRSAWELLKLIEDAVDSVSEAEEQEEEVTWFPEGK